MASAGNRMIEVARNSVQTWNIDEMGHMNVQFYVDRAADGLAAVGVHLGLGPAQLRAWGLQLVAIGQHVRFLRERHVGSPFFMRAGVLAADSERLTIYLELVGTKSGNVAAAFTLEAELRDVATQAPQPLPDTVLDTAHSLAVERPVHGQPKGLTMAPACGGLLLADADAMGMLPTFQALVQPWECGANGLLLLRHFMGHISNGVPNLMGQVGASEFAGHSNVGGAALEYRFVYRRYPQVGDVVALRSAFTGIGEKTYTMCHWLFDVETGVALASAEAVGITLDLAARKAMSMPAGMRSNLQSALVEGLAV